jgi:hypothetical protein
MPNIPEWASSTPYDAGYQLAMDNGETDIQVVKMNREEYEALKEHLAAMRGYRHESELAACSAAGLSDETVKAARELYENFPTMVVFDGKIREEED